MRTRIHDERTPGASRSYPHWRTKPRVPLPWLRNKMLQAGQPPATVRIFSSFSLFRRIQLTIALATGFISPQDLAAPLDVAVLVDAPELSCLRLRRPLHLRRPITQIRSRALRLPLSLPPRTTFCQAPLPLSRKQTSTTTGRTLS